MAVRHFTSGRGGTVLFGANSVCVYEWSLMLEGSRLDTTNVCDGIYNSFITGPINVSGELKAYYDTANPIWAAPVTLTVGMAVTLTLNIGQSGSAWVVPALVDSVSQVNNAKEVVTFSMKFVYNPPAGALIYPT